MKGYPYSFHVALDGNGINGLEGMAGVCLFLFNPGDNAYAYKIKYYQGIAAGHWVSVNPAGTYGFLGNAGQHLLFYDAKTLEDAGAFAIVLELVPAPLAAAITKSLTIPTIGIGAGKDCDGQVLVLPDLLGLNDRFSAKFVKRYANLADEVKRAVQGFAAEVREGKYPDPEHSFQK